jgi:hypothetical protein
MPKKRQALTPAEIEGQEAAELPDREMLSLVTGPAPSQLLPSLHAAAAQSAAAAAPAAEDVASTVEDAASAVEE